MQIKNSQFFSFFRKKETLLIFLFYAAVSLILALFFILPAINDIKNEAENLSLEQNKIASFENFRQKVENFKKDYDSYSENLNKIDRIFIDSQNPVAFLEFLEKSASDSGVLLEVSPIFVSRQGADNFADMQISCQGSFEEVLNFLRRIELGDYLIKVENLTIKESANNKKSKAEQKIGAVLSIRTFAQPQ